MTNKLTTGQRVVLRAIYQGHKPGIAPGALGRIVASLYDRKLVQTTAQHSSCASCFADLRGWMLTREGAKQFHGVSND